MTITSPDHDAALERKMGPEFTRLFLELDGECDWLRHKWTEFDELWGKGAEQVDLLNTVAPNFFYVINQVLFENVMLHLCRLTDPPKSMGQANLTVRSLSEPITDPVFKMSVEDLATKASMDCQFARDWRNKRLAHMDLKAFRGELASPLPDVTAEKIRAALSSLRAIFITVEEHCGIPPSGFSGDPWGASALAFHLKKSVEAIETENERWHKIESAGRKIALLEPW
jgi:hypothetical protein